MTPPQEGQLPIPRLQSRDANAQTVLDFWVDAGPSRWFAKDQGFDQAFERLAMVHHEAAARGALNHWATDIGASLALILLLDQFPRNVFRGTPRMFATDAAARDQAQAAQNAGHDLAVAPPLRIFFYLPWMHSEALTDQETCLALHQAMGPQWVRHAQEHRDIIARFGRFPHRNDTLGRPSTPDERAFLAAGGFKG